MISLPNNLPLVRFSDGQVIPFERGWLAGTLARAAERAGYKKWWLAPHVTESVTSYLEQDFDRERRGHLPLGKSRPIGPPGDRLCRRGGALLRRSASRPHLSGGAGSGGRMWIRARFL